MKKPKNYVNNKDFYEALKDYLGKVKAYEAGELKKQPVISDYIGSCFIQISKGVATKGCFSGYTFKDEMIDDGIENCVVAIHSFDPEKGTNPFAYFTQIVWYAFLRRIEKESKQSYIKHMSLVNASIHDLAIGGNELSEARILIDDEKAASYVQKYSKKKTVKKNDNDTQV